jgi:oligopeptide transport system substrate-binding protein
MLLVGELDAHEFIQLAPVETLEGHGYEPMTYVASFAFVHMNSAGINEESAPFMANTNFRRALNYAINRDALVASVLRGTYPTYRLTHPEQAGVETYFNIEFPLAGWPTAGDPEAARAHLEMALEVLGATIDDVPVLSMLVFEAETSMLILQAVQDMLLTVLGVRAQLSPQPIQMMLDMAVNGDWDLWWGGRGFGTLDWLSPGGFADVFDRYNAGQVANFNNDRFQELISAARATMDISERKEILFETEQVLIADPPSILVGWRQIWVVHNPHVTGIIVSNGDADFTFVDFTE